MSAAQDRPPTPTKCTRCNRPLHTPLVCDSCHTLFPPDRLNHFELFGLPPAYELDVADLRARYLHISRDAHPDHHRDDPQLSLRVSAELNEAYRVLTDPLLRAEYLLELHGGKSAIEDKSVPPNVLTTTLELREAVAEARAAGNTAVQSTLRKQIDTLQDQQRAAVADLARQLPGDEPLRDRLRSALNALKYYTKIASELD